MPRAQRICVAQIGAPRTACAARSGFGRSPPTRGRSPNIGPLETEDGKRTFEIATPAPPRITSSRAARRNRAMRRKTERPELLRAA